MSRKIWPGRCPRCSSRHVVEKDVARWSFYIRIKCESCGHIVETVDPSGDMDKARDELAERWNRGVE